MTSMERYGDTFFRQGQIRLAELSVYNWGSFEGLHTARIDPEGTLITGDNGSGKSTFVDGLMALLLPAGRATFNVAAAQGDRTDRSLLSYMRGSFGAAHEGSGTRVKSKREKAVVTGLRALYRADDDSVITLAALFWATQASNSLSEVKRVYAVSRRNLELKELLEAFGEGSVTALKQMLRNDPLITCCDDRFSDYQELYRKLLFMENKNAPALLSRALGLKKIDDLTKLIRELVLEPSTIREDAKKVVEEFGDLVATHDRLVDTRAQVEHLSPLPDLSQTLRQAEQALQRLRLEKEHLGIYFGEVLAQLWSVQVEALKAEVEKLQEKLESLAGEEQEAEALVERRHGEYLKHGGEKVESLKKDILQSSGKLAEVSQKASAYQQDMGVLGLSDLLSEEAFSSNKKAVATLLGTMAQKTEASQDHFADTSAELGKAQEAIGVLESDIREIKARPDSNIDHPYQRLREELVQSLGLSADELIFVGELIDVQEHERPWQGAIERALGGLRTTLLVPGDSFSMVTRWLNARHTGLHVRAQVVDDKSGNQRPPEFKESGFLKKLDWRQHPYRDWLKHHLSKFDLACVNTTEDLDVTPFSMTREGLIHKERGRFEKKDLSRIDDRRQWSLGFSNKSRLSILNSDLGQLKQRVTELADDVAKARKAMDEVSGRKTLLERVDTLRWEEIDVPRWKGKLEQLKEDLQAIEASQGDLAEAKRRWEDAKLARQRIQHEVGEVKSKLGGVDNQLKISRQTLKQAQEAASPGMTDECRGLLDKRVGPITLDQAYQQGEVEKELDSLINKEQARHSTASNRANNIMGAFRGKDQWLPVVVDWPTGLDALDDYLEYLNQLETEGLPVLVDQFRERLNKHATQSLANINNKLSADREDILERIDTINEVLRRTEFRVGSYLKLGTSKERYPHVVDFERKLRNVLGQVTSDDHEGRFNALSDVVSILDKASSSGTSGSLESLRLLDPRYQMTFFAEEVDATTLEIRDVLRSSSGKSGGEKESFAGMVVAASLAYVLTPDGYDRPVYSTVFLDEAFSNTAESVSRRVLKVFKELHIHVSLITPYKNLNLARESARSLLIAERDAENHESRLCELTWQQIDQKLAEAKRLSVMGDAESLGIGIDE
ncbi:ATP-binding protein [Marinobacter sp. ES-1]|uniref:ATP-binding protein n=1 Tax=Marinobacter sp. ES-1 TaxID=1396858 RepID=UPI0009DB7F90|nr:ATP-binding protein [Marinobacter sp. ES-1]